MEPAFGLAVNKMHFIMLELLTKWAHVLLGPDHLSYIISWHRVVMHMRHFHLSSCSNAQCCTELHSVLRVTVDDEPGCMMMRIATNVVTLSDALKVVHTNQDLSLLVKHLWHWLRLKLLSLDP